MDSQFIDYAFQDLPRKKIVKYARQYEGVNMAEWAGANADRMPFLIQDGPDDFTVMFWNFENGVSMLLDEDSVRHYATVKYLIEHDVPVFRSTADAEDWAKTHNWPRKERRAP